MGNTVDMIWVDVETTGLMEGVDKILEVGIVLTDRFGEWVAGDSWLVGGANYTEAVKRGKDHEIVGPMHEMSGLWNEWERAMLRFSASMMPESREVDILEFLHKFGVKNGKCPMAGATVHFDRKMLAAQFPTLEAFFHYRNFDISTIKQAAKWLNPNCSEPDPAYAADLTPHRGMDDCLWEIHEYKHFIENFLFTTEPEPQG